MSDFSHLRIALALALGTMGGCALPYDDPTGLELSWRFFEANVIDGDEGRRVRTCAGASIGEIEVHLEDRSDPRRRGSFPFDCEAGWQTQTQFQTRASDVFVPLHPGEYEVRLVGHGEDFSGRVAERDVEVGDRGLTVELFELVLEPVEWTLSLTGLEVCEELAVELQYADPVVALAHPPRTEDGELDPVPYRENLETDRGLALSGEPTACDEALDGEHRVADVDRGVYRLEVTVDGRRCPLEITIDEDARTLLDLSSLPCDA